MSSAVWKFTLWDLQERKFCAVTVEFFKQIISIFLVQNQLSITTRYQHYYFQTPIAMNVYCKYYGNL